MSNSIKKDAYYFSHDSNARNDEKILLLRMELEWEGYGIYWAIIEKLREAKNYELSTNYNLIAYDLRADNEKIKFIVTGFGLFSIDEEKKVFYSESLKNRMNYKLNLSINGIKGNLIKNNHISREQAIKLSNDEVLELNENIKKSPLSRPPFAPRSPGERPPLALKESKVKESKGKEIKEKEKKESVSGNDDFYKNALSKMLNNQKLLEQVSIFNKFPKELLLVIPKNFIDHCEANTTTWDNERDMYKHYQNWAKYYKVEKNINRIKEY